MNQLRVARLAHESNEATNDGPLLWDAAQLAEVLGVSERTIRRMDSEGRLPRPIQLTSRAVRWRAAEIRDWVDVRCPSRDVWEQELNQDANGRLWAGSPTTTGRNCGCDPSSIELVDR